MGGLDVGHLGAFGAGMLSFLSPCVLPLVPPYLCFVGGVSLDRLAGEGRGREDGGRATAPVLAAAVAFVLGFSTVFVALGATASGLGRLLADHFDALAQVAGVVVIVLGLHFLGMPRFGLLDREARLHPAARPAGFVGAYIVGLAFAFGWTPCVGPVLAAILVVAGSTGETWTGASLLGAYAAGIGLPFLAAALALRPFLGLAARFRRYAAGVERALGALLVGTGVLFLTGGMADIAFLLLETFPALGRIG